MSSHRPRTNPSWTKWASAASPPAPSVVNVLEIPWADWPSKHRSPQHFPAGRLQFRLTCVGQTGGPTLDPAEAEQPRPPGAVALQHQSGRSALAGFHNDPE